MFSLCSQVPIDFIGFLSDCGTDRDLHELLANTVLQYKIFYVKILIMLHLPVIYSIICRLKILFPEAYKLFRTLMFWWVNCFLIVCCRSSKHHDHILMLLCETQKQGIQLDHMKRMFIFSQDAKILCYQGLFV